MSAGLLVPEFNGGGQGLDKPLVEEDDLVGLLQQGQLLALHLPAEVPPGLEQLHH